MILKKNTTARPTHPWLRRMHVAFAPGHITSLLDEEVASGLLNHFHLQGHQVQITPDDRTDVILTTAPFGEPVGWRQALLFTARRRFKLSRSPALYTLVHAPPEEFQRLLDHFRAALAKEPPDPADYAFPGLAPQAHRVLFEQGHRGGPILALERLVQAQTKSIRMYLLNISGGSWPRTDSNRHILGLRSALSQHLGVQWTIALTLPLFIEKIHPHHPGGRG